MIEKNYNSFYLNNSKPKTASKSVKLDTLVNIAILRKKKKTTSNFSVKRLELNDDESICSNSRSVKSILKSKNSSSDKKTTNICFVDKSPFRKKQISEIINIKSYKAYNAVNAFTYNHDRNEDEDDSVFSCNCIII